MLIKYELYILVYFVLVSVCYLKKVSEILIEKTSYVAVPWEIK